MSPKTNIWVYFGNQLLDCLVRTVEKWGFFSTGPQSIKQPKVNLTFMTVIQPSYTGYTWGSKILNFLLR